jgi:hypothetical protein
MDVFLIKDHAIGDGFVAIDPRSKELRYRFVERERFEAAQRLCELAADTLEAWMNADVWVGDVQFCATNARLIKELRKGRTHGVAKTAL